MNTTVRTINEQSKSGTNWLLQADFEDSTYCRVSDGGGVFIKPDKSMGLNTSVKLGVKLCRKDIAKFLASGQVQDLVDTTKLVKEIAMAKAENHYLKQGFKSSDCKLLAKSNWRDFVSAPEAA